MALPTYPLDDTLATLGSLDQRIATIRSILPTNLNGKAYKDFWIEVPGLAEKRPSVLIGDSVHLCLQRNSQRWFEGRVHVVQEREVGLRFHKRFTYIKGEPYSSHILNLRRPSPRAMEEIRVFNPQITSNPPQLEAVTAIVNRPHGGVPFVIWGPPGTGKTVTVVEAIRQVLRNDPTARILACAPSNSAADLIAQRLVSLGKENLFRMNAPSRFRNRLPDDLRDFSYKDRDGHFSVRGAEHVKQFRVVVSTCLSASIPYGVGVDVGHFSHIFIDEAGQAVEPEIMVPIKTMADHRTTIVLSGDPKQLGPIVRSAVASHLGLATSFLNRLVERDVYSDPANVGITMVKLTKNWRSHDAILRFPNETFYNNGLQVCGPPTVIDSLLQSPVLAKKNFPVVFHGIAGMDDREAGSPSYFNIDEFSLICKYVDDLRNDRVCRLADQDIGIISPYNAQAKKIRARLAVHHEYIKVGSVEEFQGQERTVVLITTVRSQIANVSHDLKHVLGFLVNPRRMNVALTRAKALLVVVGNPLILGLDPLWLNFLNYVHRNGGWKGIQPDWDPSQDSSNNQAYAEVGRATGESELTEMEVLAEQLRTRVTIATEVNAGEGDAYDDERRDANEDRGPWIQRDDE
ncbi:hypothetical protein FRB90_006969 [Tulasnella sp. 427]|nr:hypothetical protein FRB90_006969 [Tulasnella sp. 427]